MVCVYVDQRRLSVEEGEKEWTQIKLYHIFSQTPHREPNSHTRFAYEMRGWRELKETTIKWKFSFHFNYFYTLFFSFCRGDEMLMMMTIGNVREFYLTLFCIIMFISHYCRTQFTSHKSENKRKASRKKLV